MKSDLSATRDLADGLRRQAAKTGATTPSVRGADWRLATVTVVGADGTVTADGITVRRLDSYTSPAVGDVIVIEQSSSGNWISPGRTTTAPGGWTALTLASGYIHPGHGYAAGWLRDGNRIWLRGRISRTGGATLPNGTTIATIPAGIRPAGGVDVGWAVARDGGTYPATVRVDITTAGVLRTYEATSLPTWISLDGISYTIT
ncbi:hypothetical protein ACIQFU_23210 [Streptomyces sp. NPDC093065]|uniref:hypothetical protein n=1 Tax=Streptomyces sp. NPDC093065 TaxID=3366021 RepID=UPI00380EB363